MGDAVASGMTERHVIPAFAAWRDMRIDTLAEMVDRVARGVKADLEASNNARIGAVTAEWQNKLRAELGNITRPISNRWHIDPGALSLAPITVRTGQPSPSTSIPGVSPASSTPRRTPSTWSWRASWP